MTTVRMPRYARELFTKAGITPTEQEVKVLADDIRAIVADELDGFDPTNGIPSSELIEQAIDILVSRIAGVENLRSYVDCLMAGRS